ncbi:MAG: hypothetical protein RLP12_02690 [Ekhidna sp.]
MKISSKQAIEILGTIAVVLSLLFVGFEVRLARTVADSQFINETANLTSSFNDKIINNSDVWIRGCMGEELNLNESLIFNYLAHSFVNHEFTRWGRDRTFSGSDGRGITPVARNLYNFPGIKAAWDSMSQRGSPEVLQAVTDAYESMKSSNTPKNIDASLCGK